MAVDPNYDAAAFGATLIVTSVLTGPLLMAEIVL
jgi:hypothetical protein